MDRELNSDVAVSLASLNIPTSNKNKNVDQGYAWIIMGAVFVSSLLQASHISTGTLLYQAMLDRYGFSATEAGWIISSSASIRLLSSPLVGLLLQRFSNRAIAMAGGFVFSAGYVLTAFATNIWMLYSGYGLLAGIGCNMMVLSSLVIIAQYFVKKRGIAMSFTMCGSGIGAMVFPPLVTRSFESFGYSLTVMFLACVLMQIVVSTSLYKPQTLEVEIESAGNSVKSKWQRVKEKSGLNLLGRPVTMFLLVVIASLQCMVAIGQIFISGLAIERANMSENEIAIALSIAAFSEFCKLPVGFCFDNKTLWPYRTYLFCIASIVMGLLAIALSFTTEIVMFTVIFTVYTFFAMGAMSQYVTILGDMVTIEELPNGIALCRTVMGILLLAVPLAIGRIKDLWNSFQYGFILLSVIHTFIVICYTIVYFFWSRHKTKCADVAEEANEQMM